MSAVDGEPGFAGTVGRTVGGSAPWWPAAHRVSGPNVVVIVLDDVGFAQLGCYGSSIATPTMDALAAGGLRYTNFHVTGLCSTTRACLLTGRNHHSVGVGFLTDYDTGFPSYRGFVSPSAGTMGEVLGAHGYGATLAGKWHLTPPTAMTPAGPFDHWPTRRGFDRYYGFLWGEDDQWSPELWQDHHRVDPPDDPDYHLSADLVDRSIAFLSDHLTAAPDRPFLHYLAFGACHAPHQAPREWIDRYAGAYDHGWDVERERVLSRQRQLGVVPGGTELAPRNPGVRPWDDLHADERRLAARLQEAFAGFMSHTDAQIGRLVDFLRRYDVLDDTVILLMSDNGASGEGGEHGSANEYRYFLGLPDPFADSLAAIDEIGGHHAHNHYPAGWAQAGNTPFRFYKKHTHAGGVRAPLILHWPRGVDRPGLRHQFHHAIDILPTLLELSGAEAPEELGGVPQRPLHGVSMAYSLNRPDAASVHPTQYFETAGYRGLVHDGWKAVAEHVPGTDFDDDHWALYRLTEDVSETHDLSVAEPALAAELERRWWSEAERYRVLPLDDRMGERALAMDPASDRRDYTMLPGTRFMNGVVGPNFGEREFTIEARISRSRASDGGVLLAFGRRASGFALYVDDGRPAFHFNLAGQHTLVRAAEELPLGAARVAVRVESAQSAGSAGETDAPAEADSTGVWAVLLVDDRVVARGRLPRLVPGGLGTMSVQCGHNSPSPVTDAYRPPARFTGDLDRVEIRLGPQLVDTHHRDHTAAMSQQ